MGSNIYNLLLLNPLNRTTMKPQKLVKVTINGRRQSPIDLKRTWLGRLVYKTKMFLKGLLFWSVIIGSIFLAVRVFFPKVEYSIVEKEIVIDNLSEKINELKGKLIADLIKGENGPVVKYDPPTHKFICPEDAMSFGKYQFKICTVTGYYKKLYSKVITKKEAVLIALDDDKAGELAKDMIFKEKGGIENWFNTANKYNLREQLAIIKSLEK